MLLFANDFDAPPAARCGRLHNVHMLVSFSLPLIQPAFVVLGEYVRGWGDIIFHAMTPSHFEYISPEVIFPPELPAAREMINFLILINIFKFPWLDYSGPEDVPC